MILPNGLLTLNKPQWMTSRQAVTRVTSVLRKAGFGRRIRVGHCGTLDPLATGVLVICVGKATRLVQMIQERQKTYVGRFQLGRVTSTDDTTGSTLSETEVCAESITEDSINALLPDFTGENEQVPPKFSAVHVDGKRAYKLARQGKEVELTARTVHIDRLELTAFELPEIELLIQCGSGTYVRSLGRDIGERLGCGATMKGLIRTAIGPFNIDQAIDPNELNEENIISHLQPLINAVSHFPCYDISEQQKCRAYDGRLIEIGSIEKLAADLQQPGIDGRLMLIGPDQQLVAVASYNATEGMVKPVIVFHDPPRGH